MRALEVGAPGHDAVLASFGSALLGPDGAIDRGRLAERVFGDPLAREDLERIVHPIVHERLLGALEARPGP